MAFVNLPPALQDIFRHINDRLAKVEAGPSQAMYTATSAQFTAASAQSVATNAQIQAVLAGVQANNAASQATIAQAQATIASTQATAAQTSANGKNRIWYSVTTPGTTANTVGDIWYQYGTTGTYANKVIAQWTGAGGTSWTSVVLSGLVLSTLDAGSITTGTLTSIQITAGSGSQLFKVSSLGALTATGAVISGNITATSGTFTGSIFANSGYFGTAPNYWQIGSTGLTGIGAATITAGAINGATITGGTIQTSASGTGIVLDGANNALGIKYGGAYSGWLVSVGAGQFRMHYGPSPNVSGVPATTVSSGAATVVGTVSTGFSANNTGTNGITGDTTFYNDIIALLAVSAATTAQPNCYITTTGQIRKTSWVSSSARFKDNITDIANVPELDPKLLLKIPVKAFTYRTDYLSENDDRYEQILPGFIVEEMDEIYPVAVDYENGNTRGWNSAYIIPGLLALIQDQEKRITKLEGK
jgi:hypothetical protein